MRINKTDVSDSADLFFEIMSAFNEKQDGLLIKQARYGEVLENFGKLTKVSDEAADAGKAGLKIFGGKGTASARIDAVLNSAAKRVTKVDSYGIGPLLKGARTTKPKNFKVFRDAMGLELDKMLKHKPISDFIDNAGNPTAKAMERLKQAARSSNMAVSPKASDEIVDAIASGNIFKADFAGGPIARRIAAGGPVDEAAGAAAAAAKGTDDAAAAAAKRTDDVVEEVGTTGVRTTDDAAAVAKRTDDVATNPRLSAEDAAQATQLGRRQQLDEISNKIRGIKSTNAIGGSVEDTVQNAFKQIDEAKAMAKNLAPPKALADKVTHNLNTLRVTIEEQSKLADNITQTINMNGATLRAGRDINITQIQAFNSILDVMDDAANHSIRQLGGVKGAVKNLNDVDAVLKQGDNIAAGGRGGAGGAGGAGGRGGRGTGTGGNATGGNANVSGGNQTIHQHFHVGPGGVKPMGDAAVEGLSPALTAHLKAQTHAMNELSQYIVKNGDEIAIQLKRLGGMPPGSAGRQTYDDMIKVIQRMDNVGNVKISGKLLDELRQAGVKVGGETTSGWAKFGKVVAWLGIAGGIGMGAHWAWNKWGPGAGAGGGQGGGGQGGGGQGGGLPQESGGNPYVGVTDPGAQQALRIADPSSPAYDPENGWKAAAQTIEALKRSGNYAQLAAFLNALQTQVYKKRFRIELKPPFVVPGSPVPLYYAFVNQHRSPAPNLSDPTGRTLKLKNMLFNDALHDGDETTIADIFDQSNALMSGDAQRAINYTAEETIAKGLAEKDTSRPWYHFGIGPDYYRGEQWLKGKKLDRNSEQGMAGQRRQRYSDGDLRMLERLRSASDNRMDTLKKMAELSHESDTKRILKLESLAKVAMESTNNNQDIENQMLKEADDFSKSYYKDAVTDLNNTDKTLRSYFTGLGGLYDQRLEKRKADFKELYNVTEGSGEDLIYSAHPKEVVVSDSIGRGGLVENGLEQKRQTHGVALSAPTGNYRANYASRHEALDEIRKLSISS